MFEGINSDSNWICFYKNITLWGEEAVLISTNFSTRSGVYSPKTNTPNSRMPSRRLTSAMAESAFTISSISFAVWLSSTRSGHPGIWRTQGQDQQGYIQQRSAHSWLYSAPQHGCLPQEVEGRKLPRIDPWRKLISYYFLDLVDAFVALGGRSDKSGVVNKSALMEIIKREFELSLDLEAMIEGVQTDNLDYETFCSIF